MEKDRHAKKITIIALFIGITMLSLGFATFSARLIINSKAIVKPDTDSFRVVLSKSQIEEIVGTVAPTGNGEEAIISNASGPIISNLKANFVNPGEKVVYEFYALNTGYLDAYLNKIEFENISDTEVNKICTAGEGTTDEYVQSSCESIRITVMVGDDDKACQTSTYNAHKLDMNTDEKIIVTIEYDSTGARADGPFSVAFGDIALTYLTTDLESKNVPLCTDFNTEIAPNMMDINGKTNIIDNDNNGKISISDKVTLGTENFYVISTNESVGTITMFAEWNLNVGDNPAPGNTGLQNEMCKGYVDSHETAYCTITFANNNYWNSTQQSENSWVYGSESNLYNHVENYVTKLKETGYSSVTGRLIKYEELVDLGCPAGSGICTGLAWVYQTTYWTGTANNSDNIWTIKKANAFTADSYSRTNNSGIRPVITISASEL